MEVLKSAAMFSVWDHRPWLQRKHGSPHSQRIVSLCSISSKGYLKDLSLLSLTWKSLWAERRWAFLGNIRWMDNLQPSGGKDDGWRKQQSNKTSRKRFFGKPDYSKVPKYTEELGKPHACPRQETCSERAWEDPKVLALANLKAQWEPEVKADAD